MQSAADALVPRGRAARWNQAMIDLGAEVCRARDPRCNACPIRMMCVWDGELTEAKPSPRFETTMRYARGRVVDVLRGGSATLGQLVRVTGLDRWRIDGALEGLVRDGLVHRSRSRSRFGLGP